MILGMGIRGSVAEPQLGLRRDLNLHRAADDQLGHAGGDAPQTGFGILRGGTVMVPAVVANAPVAVS